MIQEHKELLLRDLCARLPYGVKVNIPDLVFSSKNNIEVLKEIFCGDDGEFRCNDSGMLIKYVKPYLFPLSSMTEEQSKVYHELIGGMFVTSALINFEILEDFFHKNHLDHRGLIPMGLSIDATGLNIYWIMTTNDIEKAEILLCCKNGDRLLGITDDNILLNFIAQYAKFVKIDEEKTGTIPLSEIIKNQKENKWTYYWYFPGLL